MAHHLVELIKHPDSGCAELSERVRTRIPRATVPAVEALLRAYGLLKMVFAGRSLFQQLRTVGQTVCELAKRNVRISESEVRELPARFVIGLAAAHAEAAPRLRNRLGTNGGYILHLDSTCQKGSAHLMTGVDELSGMVLLNALYDRAIKAMQPVCDDAELAAAADRLERAAAVFDDLRVALRIAEPQSAKGLNDDGRQIDMHTIESRVEHFRASLSADPQRRALPGIDAMLAQLDKYWHRLFADPVVLETPDGERTVQPQRTNNILERFFRGLNRASRKRSGNRLTAAVLDNMLPDVPLVANLDNPDYVQLLLDGCEDLAQRLAKVDRRTVTASLIQARKPPTGLSGKTRRILRKKTLPLQIAACILRKTA